MNRVWFIGTMRNGKNDIQQAFLELMRGGLWENEVRLSQFGEVDYEEVMRLAEEQSVVGLVTAGLEHVKDVKVPQEWVLQFVGQSLQIEQRNEAMNAFIEDLYGRMQRRDMYSILMKGQGIAQCYERPLWRTSGDIDLLVNGDNYDRAKEWFRTIGQVDEDENEFRKRVNMTVDSWDVELHGTMRGLLGQRIERGIDEAQRDVFHGGSVRSWYNGKITVFLPSADNDVIFIFTHILQHFFRGGIGLRQICDWCRLMWTYRAELDLRLLESRIKRMGVMSEWRAFAALAVEYLGMPVEAMPFFNQNEDANENDGSWTSQAAGPSATGSPQVNENRRLKWKAERIMNYVMEVGNFGHNRDMSYKTEKPFMVRMMISLKHRTSDFMKQVMVFPLDAVRAYWYIWGTGLKVVVKRMLSK